METTRNLKMKKEPEIKSFSSPEKWSEWLSDNFEREEGVWLRIFKKNSGKETLDHASALDEALCYGWIDGQGKSYDELSWLIKFTPRRTKSIWSQRNKENVERLIEQKRMKAPGLKEIEKAKADGRWDAAYDSPKNMEVPPDFIDELKKDNSAYEFFKTLNKTNIYAIAWRLQTARNPETRKKRMIKLLDKMKRQEKLY